MLSVLKPTVVVNQVLNVATGITSLDILGILTNLTVLPRRVAALDARGAHEVAGQLNNQLSPLLTMAAAVDLTWVSQVLSVIPDPSGATQIAALVATILANVDVIKLANIVGQIQEIAWAAVEKLLPPPGQPVPGCRRRSRSPTAGTYGTASPKPGRKPLQSRLRSGSFLTGGDEDNVPP